MKKLGLLFATALAGITVGGLSASAAYPPGGPSLTLNPGSVVAGATFVATFTGCTAGETVNFTLNGGTTPATCESPAAGFRRPAAAAAPAASTALSAPTVPGTYPVTATGLTSGATATATLTVTAAAGGGELPTTGSDSAPTVQIATGIIAVGVGLATVGGLRRRKRAAA